MADNDNVLDKVKDTLGNIFGGHTEETAIEEPQLVGEDMGLSPHMRRDIGLGVTDVDESPYAGSAGSRALDLAAGVPPGSPEAPQQPPVDDPLNPFDTTPDN